VGYGNSLNTSVRNGFSFTKVGITMKVVGRATFLRLPQGTVFVKLNACDVSELMLKRGSYPNDFVYRSIVEIESESSNIFCDMLIDACENHTRDTIPLDWDRDIHRDGLFEEDQMFGVLDKEELTNVITMLTEARDQTFGKG
jgi:hypothetical protein